MAKVKEINNKKVSIIVPIYNKELYLERCLNSLINQSLKEIEIICIGNDLTDTSKEILQLFAERDSRITVLHVSSCTLGRMKNIGLEHAKGEFVGFINTVDWVDDNYFEELYKSAKKYDAEIAASSVLEIRNNKKQKYIMHFKKKVCITDSIEKFETLKVPEWYVFNKICKTELLRQHSLNFEEIDYYENIICSIKAVSIAQKIVVVPHIKYYYCIDKDLSVQKIGDQYYQYEDIVRNVQQYVQQNNIHSGTGKYWHKELLKSFSIGKFNLLNIYKQGNYCTFETLNFLLSKSFNIPSSKVIKEERKHLVFKLFGIKLSLKKDIRLDRIKAFASREIQPRTILLAELNTCHKETLPGYYSLLKQLGYNVDILLTGEDEGVFDRFNEKVKIYSFIEHEYPLLLKQDIFKKYDRIIYNSKIIYYIFIHLDIAKAYPFLPKGQKNNVYIQHHIDRINEIEYDEQIILANPSGAPSLEQKVVNPHYFGKVAVFPKNKIINFITIGELSSARRNLTLLLDAIEGLVKGGIINFKVTVIGKGSLESINSEIQNYFDIKGELEYSRMYQELEKADYFLTLLDPENKKHERYLKDGTSGSFQLIYGFLKPCLIHQTFAEIYGFNDKNSIVYKSNSHFVEALKTAINVSQDEYESMQKSLQKLAQDIEKTSLNNLERVLND